MVVKEVLLIGNPKLKEISKPITEHDPQPTEIIEDLKDTLLHLQDTMKIGRALSAPQISQLKQVVYYKLPDREFVMVNPDIVTKSRETYDEWDTCFSFNAAFFVEVERSRSIEVKYQDEDGNSKKEKFEGKLSGLVQHEVDHLNGILATDRIKDKSRIIMREEWERLYR